MTVNICTDCHRSVITQHAKKRGWNIVTPEKDWHVLWCLNAHCRKYFAKDGKHILTDNQLVNHFPNSYVLTRKDFLPRSIRKYRRTLMKMIERQGGHSRHMTKYPHMKIIPTTFVLPEDYQIFLEEYDSTADTTWIMKPCSSSKGNGIFLTKSISRLRKWTKQYCSTVGSNHATSTARNDNYVISRYINPLLIGGKKFDLRLYVLVTSYNPLKAYLFRHGFCRFCTRKYDTSTAKLKNRFVHLTNVSIQRRGKKYNRYHGGKWSIENLRLYLESTHGLSVSDGVFDKIKWLIIHSLKAVQYIISTDRHCFECYGYDIIIDSKLKPWLIEVNSSPSLSATTKNDRIIKQKLIDNIFSIVLPPNGHPDAWWNKSPHLADLKDFERLIDEDLAAARHMKSSGSAFLHNSNNNNKS